MIALTIELKLSSNKIISQASLATYVPAIPIANPTSAFLRAGASFVPMKLKYYIINIIFLYYIFILLLKYYICTISSDSNNTSSFN